MKAMTAKMMQPFQPTPVDNTTQDYASDSVDSSQLAPGFDYYAAATGQVVISYCVHSCAVLWCCYSMSRVPWHDCQLFAVETAACREVKCVQ